jgi:hypothetical protein
VRGTGRVRARHPYRLAVQHSLHRHAFSLLQLCIARAFVSHRGLTSSGGETPIRRAIIPWFRSCRTHARKADAARVANHFFQQQAAFGSPEE